MAIKLETAQIEVEVIRVEREAPGEGHVGGGKRNKQLGGISLWSVYYRRGEPVLVDGCGRPHPKLVLKAAAQAWAEEV